MSFEINAESLKNAKVTVILVISNILIFIIVNLILGNQALFEWEQYNRAIFEDKEYYRLLSSMFVHSGPEHLLNNMLSLFFLGAATEELVRKHYYLLIYFVSGLIGSIFSYLLLPLDSIGLGASGAIAGLMGALLVLIKQRDRRLWILTGLYLVSFVVNSFQPGIGTWAHIFGLLGGLGIGLILRKTNQILPQSPAIRRNSSY